jgi:tetratricopeptide (TPR) repeat protein
VRATTLAIAQAPARGVLRQIAAEALFDFARSLDLRGSAIEAVPAYEEAVHAWPDLAEGYVNLGRMAGLLGRRAEAEAYLRRALEANPLSSSAHDILGRLLAEAGDESGAARHLREAIRISPLDAEEHERLGLSLAMAQRPDDALNEFREALRLAPDWPEALERVALLLATHPDARSRRPAEGLRHANRAVALTSEKDPMALEVQAAAFASNGQFAEAEGAERKVLSIAIASHNGGLESAARALIDRYGRGMTIEASQPPALAQ